MPRKTKQADREYQRKWRAKRKELGLCLSCSNLAVPGMSLCEKHRAKNKERSGRVIDKRRKQQKCLYCNNLAIPGETRCQKHATQQTEKYRERRESGICVMCDKPAVTGFTKCEDHLLYKRNKALEAYNKKKSSGICVICGKNPARPGRTECETCAPKSSSKSLKYQWGDVRNAILDRDGHKCGICASTKNLCVHHKDGNGFTSKTPNHDPENLITLCRHCHAAITKLRKHNRELAAHLILY